MTLVWTREQRRALEALSKWRLPGTYTAAYAPREIEIARRGAARERAQRRQRLAHQIAIAIGWSAP